MLVKFQILSPVFSLKRFESDYLAIHFVNIICVSDLLPDNPKTAIKIGQSLNLISFVFNYPYFKISHFPPVFSLERFESDYFVNILCVRDLPPIYPKTTTKIGYS